MKKGMNTRELCACSQEPQLRQMTSTLNSRLPESRPHFSLIRMGNMPTGVPLRRNSLYSALLPNMLGGSRVGVDWGARVGMGELCVLLSPRVAAELRLQGRAQDTAREDSALASQCFPSPTCHETDSPTQISLCRKQCYESPAKN